MKNDSLPLNTAPRALLADLDLGLPANRHLTHGARTSGAAHAASVLSSAAEVVEAPLALAAVKARLHAALLDDLEQRQLLGLAEAELDREVESFVERVLNAEDLPLNTQERSRLAAELREEIAGLGPLAPLMADPAVTDILVNGPDQVYVERYGKLERTAVQFRNSEHLLRLIQRIAARVGRRIDEAWPMVDARLPDGSRVNATVPPVTLDGPTLSIRRFGVRRLRAQELVQLGMLSPVMHAFLKLVVASRKNVLISGGTGAGKSTLLSAIAEAIPPTERIITIEDAAELLLDQPHVVRMETRPPNIEQQGRITARDLVINALRMRPDRIIVGEVRGPEAVDMLQAMNTGHEGSLSTIHANSPRDALARLETMVLMAALDLPSRAIREQMVSALHYIVHVRRYEDGIRRLEAVVEVCGMEGLTPQLQTVFAFERQGRRGRAVHGSFVSSGVVPRLVEELRELDVSVPLEWFQPGASAHG